MGKPDFCTIDCAISGGFDDCEERCEVRIEDDRLDCFLLVVSVSPRAAASLRPTDFQNIHLADLELRFLGKGEAKLLRL